MKIPSLLLCVAAFAADQPEKPAEIKPRPPVLSAVFPQGWQPGTTLRVDVLGQYLDRAGTILFLDPSIRGRVVEGSHSRMTLEFQIAPDAFLGPHYFRVVSPRGASNVLLFRVGDLPHVREIEPNSSIAEAQPVAAPATINGQLPIDGDFDFFRFHADKGQTWVLDVRASRNGSGLDPALILLDSRGRKLAHSEEYFIWDPLLIHTFAEAGDYVVAIQPTSVRNDPGFAYQLDIRTAPHIDTIAPLSLRPGARTEVRLFGGGITPAPMDFDAPGFTGRVLDAGRAEIQAPADAAGGVHRFAIRTSSGHSNWTTFLVDSLPAHRGGETITPPVSINGIARYRQAERFWFDAAAGQKLLFEVRAQRFGSPADTVLRILDDKGRQIALNDDGAFPGTQFNKDPQILHKFEAAGRYQVEIRSLYKVSGEDNPYQLIVREPRPSAAIMLATDNPYVYAGGEGKLKLTAVRREGYDGSIPVMVEGLPAGIKIDPVEILAGKSEAEITFHADSTLRPGDHFSLRIPSGWRSVRIASGGGEGAASGGVHEATLAVIDRPHYSLEAAVTSLNLVRGAQASVPVMIQRAPGFESPIRFTFENLPPGVTADDAVAGPAESQIQLRLRASEAVKLGRAPRIIILGRADSGEVQEAPKIGLVID